MPNLIKNVNVDLILKIQSKKLMQLNSILTFKGCFKRNKYLCNRFKINTCNYGEMARANSAVIR